MYYKNHYRRNFYSTLCHTAKQNQRYNLIQSTQNDSTSIEHNSKTLAQNKFNTRQPIQKSNGPRPAPKPNYFYSSHLSSRLKLSLSRLLRLSFVVASHLFAIKRAHTYVGIRSHDDKLLAQARLFSNFLGRTPLARTKSYIREHSTTGEI